jgi:UDP-3-O-[3-hydroxymyristoyl] N-acetylglucosamine deacetylase
MVALKKSNPKTALPAGAIPQKTLKSSISCTGVALHSGEKTSMTLCPAEPDMGILFKRVDPQGLGAEIPARWDCVVDTRLCSVVGNEDGVTVGTVEHLMSALAGAGIDNCLIEIDGPEVPIMDGSAAPFLFLVECAGVVEQPAARKAIRVLKPVTVEHHGKSATLSPADGFMLDFEIDFDSDAIRQQTLSVDLHDGIFKKEIARARTFGFMHEVEALWAAGLAKGGSLDNAVVVSGNRILNEDGLRYEDEFVRHKVLDAVGDLYLAGAPIMGAFRGVCSGHAVNNALLRALFADPEAWCYEDVGAESAGVWRQRAAIA